MDAQGIAVIIGSIGVLVTGMLGVFYKTTKDNSKERAATAKCNTELIANLTKVVQENSDVNKQVVETSNRVAIATERSAQEAKERNGHLAEIGENSQKMILKSQEMVDRNLKKYKTESNNIMQAIKFIDKQHVKLQEIDSQTIHHKE